MYNMTTISPQLINNQLLISMLKLGQSEAEMGLIKKYLVIFLVVVTAFTTAFGAGIILFRN